MAIVRYLVNEVDVSIEFYTRIFKFELQQQFGSAVAILKKNDLTLWLAGPPSYAAKPMPDGRKPEPGGWNRFVFQVENLESVVTSLREKDVKFRNVIISGPGGDQILCEDHSGNIIELFQPNGLVKNA